MTTSISRVLRSLRWPLATILLSFQVVAIGAAPAPTLSTADAARAGRPKVEQRTEQLPSFEWSIQQGTQFNFADLSIGLGDVDSGVYLDMVGAKQVGLHASIDISIEGDPSKFRQADVHEGQILLAAGYRILIEKIIPGDKGTLVLRVWGPPKSADK